ncbi:hypothetical protein [Maribellus mangrovi]|uniref:hypothetical protein n=1 Tax=Maribellus mangrovi TaxID=3133146 RepID=UPI0030EDD5ED
MKLIFTLLAIMVFQFTLNATVWRVNNDDNTADFADIIDAHDDAGVQSGDILMVEGSNTTYTSFTCTKSLTIIGPGYLLTENYESAHILPANINRIIFEDGSQGSSVYGMSFISAGGTPIVLTDEITIERCYISAGLPVKNAKNVRIINNNMHSVGDYYNGTGPFSDVYINNNIIRNKMGASAGSHIVTFNNNILLGDSYGFNAEYFRNNIVWQNDALIKVNSAYIENNIASNNILTGDNLNVENIQDLFVGGDSPDAKYKLAEGSEAIGAGFGGTDCGIFGGEDPYIISGLPPVPVITELSVDDASISENGLQVKITVRSN